MSADQVDGAGTLDEAQFDGRVVEDEVERALVLLALRHHCDQRLDVGLRVAHRLRLHHGQLSLPLADKTIFSWVH